MVSYQAADVLSKAAELQSRLARLTEDDRADGWNERIADRVSGWLQRIIDQVSADGLPAVQNRHIQISRSLDFDGVIQGELQRLCGHFARVYHDAE